MSDRYVAYFIGGSLDLTKRVVEHPLAFFEAMVLEREGFKHDELDRPIPTRRETYRLQYTNMSGPPWRPKELVYILIER